MVDLSRCAANHREVDHFHPGVLEIVEVLPRTKAERLEIAESRLLDLAMEDGIRGRGERRDLALAITVLRAEITG